MMIFNLILFFLVQFAQSSEEDLFGSGASTSSESQSSKKFNMVFSGTVDFRAYQTGSDLSWARKGRGLSHHGANSLDEASLQFGMPRIALVSEFLFEQNSHFFLQINLDDHENDPTSNASIHLFEAYLQSRPFSKKNPYRERLGIFVPPISLEHEETAWSTQYTITPSAINTWVGEELKVLGIEENIRIRLGRWQKLLVTLSAFTHNDPTTAILAWRGWALHDYQLKLGDRLQFQEVLTDLAPSGWGIPFKELDGKPAVFGKLKYQSGDTFSLSAFHYQSFSKGTETDSIDYAWNTGFSNVSLKWHLSSRLTLLSQFMMGKSYMGFADTVNFVSIDFSSFYGLLNYQRNKHSLTFRYDSFEVLDIDDVNDDNNQSGTAMTFSYGYQYSRQQRFNLEFLSIDSRRKGRENYPDTDPNDNLIMLNYRLTL